MIAKRVTPPSQLGLGLKVRYRGFSHKAALGLWQAVSYTDSEFYLDDVTIRPKFALLFSNISFEREHQSLNRLDTELENDRALCREGPCREFLAIGHTMKIRTFQTALFDATFSLAGLASLGFGLYFMANKELPIAVTALGAGVVLEPLTASNP